MSPGMTFQVAVAESTAAKLPLHVIGVADGSDAIAAEKAGFQAIYLSGSQMAAARGWADIGMLELHHVIEHVQRIMDSGVKLPLLVDIDTGFDDITETIRALEKLGVAAVHVEDQQDLKMCGHLDGKHVIDKESATERVARAAKARSAGMVIMARTDALAVEGLEKTLERIGLYSRAGADMIFAEAFEDPKTYEAVKKASGGKEVLANMTEFGKVKLQTPAELQADSKGAISIVMNPLTVYRAQRKTAAELYPELAKKGTDVVTVADGSDALEAQRAGFKSIYLSAQQVAQARGWENTDKLELKHLIETAHRILDSGTKLPLTVDISPLKDKDAARKALEALNVTVDDKGHGPAAEVYIAQRQTAESMYRELREKGTQRGMEPRLQTRQDFQALIGYDEQRAKRTLALLNNPGNPNKLG